LCYDFVGPVAQNMAKIADEVPSRLRPSFTEMEKTCKQGHAAAAAAADSAG
jgi:hypothetical protein